MKENKMSAWDIPLTSLLCAAAVIVLFAKFIPICSGRTEKIEQFVFLIIFCYTTGFFIGFRYVIKSKLVLPAEIAAMIFCIIFMRLELGADNTGLKILFDLLAGIFLSSVSALNAVHLFMPFYQYFNDLKSDDKNNKKSESNDITADIVPDTGEQFRVSTAPKCAPNSNFSAESAQCRDCVLESEQGTKA